MNSNFEQMKREVLENFSDEKLFKTSILNCPELWQTTLYKFCQKIPKGADLHAHGGALTPAWSLINFVKAQNDILIDTNPEHKGYLILKNKNPEVSYMTLKDAIVNGYFTEDELTKIWTLQGCPSGTDVWDYFQTLFEMHNDLNEVGPTCKDYFQYSYEYYCRQNIFHLEQRLFLKNTEDEAFQKAHCAFDAYIDAKKQYPNLTVRIIPVGLKHSAFGMEVTENIFHNAAVMNHKIKDGADDFVVGIDLVNEEDVSRSIIEFKSLIKDTINKAPNLNVNLHAGESNSTKNCEIKNAISFGSKRIGHGLNLWAHPELKDEIKNKNICLEVCPVSNFSLGFCEDLRKHPAATYLREGIPMVLASDDPTYQENSTLSDDFFCAILAWDLNIDEVEYLCENSIKYSYLSESIKQQKISELKKDWNKLLTC